jgi:hypothetical protein
MYRALALLALSLLAAGCGSSRTSSEPPTTIDTFRSSYLEGKPAASSQLAAVPDQTVGQAKAAPKSLTDPSARAGDVPAAADAAATKQAAPPYKASVAAYIKRYAVDSNSLKQAKIGTPFQGSVNGQKGSVVCVELGGMRENRTAYLLKDDAVIDSEFGAAACRDKQLEPWNSVGT